MKRMMILYAAMMMSWCVMADTEVVNGIEWTYTVSDGEASVGGGWDGRAFPNSTTGGVVIPSKLDGYPVTHIGDGAFSDCYGLTNVTIPNSVMSIGSVAFAGCSGLKSVAIPSSVTSIGEGAFLYCSGLTSFVVDADNSNYKSVNGLLLTKDGRTLVAGVNGDVVIPKSVTSIGDYSFYWCRDLTSVTIPKSVTSIGEWAFAYCFELASMTIPSSVTNVGRGALCDCSNLKNMVIGAVISDIRDHTFAGCECLSSVTLPLSVVNIDNCAFLGCVNMSSVGIPPGVTNIGDSAFEQCAALKSVTIPSSVTRIGADAFLGCHMLEDVTIPNSVISIGKDAFRGCDKLSAINVLSGNGSYSSDEGVLFDRTKTRLIMCPQGKRGDYVLPASVTTIGIGAFQDCVYLTRIEIALGVGDVSYGVFWGCEKLSSIQIPSSVTNICDNAFYDCGSLMSVTIPSGVTSIGRESFSWCRGLTSVTIPSSVTNVGHWTFYVCDNLKTIYVDEGDEDRVRDLLEDSEFDTEQVRFVVKGAMPTFEVVAGMKFDEHVGLENYKAKGLPKGLTYNAKAGKVTGTCKAAEGEYKATFTKKGAADVVLTFVVSAERTPTIVCEGLAGGTMIVGVAGGGRGATALPIAIDAESGVKSVTATKLPTGMKIASSKDKTSWYITGAPTKAGMYEVAITLTTVAGNKVTEKFSVTVAALPSGATGTFNGFVVGAAAREVTRSTEDDATVNVGTLQVTVSDAGKITAKVVAAAGTYSFTATGWDSVTGGVYYATMKTKKGDVLTLKCDSTAAWNAKQMTGTFAPVDAIVSIASNKDGATSSDALETNASTYAVEAQKNAFGKQWFFMAELAAREDTSSTEGSGAEGAGAEAWVLSFAENAKAAALTVTLNADGRIAVAGTLYGAPVTDGKKTTTPSYKISASGYADVSGIADGAIFADFAPVLSIKSGKTTTKKVLSLRTNLWFDKKNDHAEGVGSAVFVP